MDQEGWWLYTKKPQTAKQILADKHKGKKCLIAITWSSQDNGKFQRPWSAAMGEEDKASHGEGQTLQQLPDFIDDMMEAWLDQSVCLHLGSEGTE